MLLFHVTDEKEEVSSIVQTAVKSLNKARKWTFLADASDQAALFKVRARALFLCPSHIPPAPCGYP